MFMMAPVKTTLFPYMMNFVTQTPSTS